MLVLLLRSVRVVFPVSVSIVDASVDVSVFIPDRLRVSYPMTVKPDPGAVKSKTGAAKCYAFENPPRSTSTGNDKYYPHDDREWRYDKFFHNSVQ